MSIESVMPSNHLILLSPSPPAFNLSQHQGLFKWVSSSGGQNIGAGKTAEDISQYKSVCKADKGTCFFQMQKSEQKNNKKRKQGPKKQNESITDQKEMIYASPDK